MPERSTLSRPTTDAPLSRDASANPIGLATSSDEVKSPVPVPCYELGEMIGSGGMGDVYRARDLELDRDVAVKILQARYPIDSSTAARFVAEAQITAQLQHPGIPAVYRVATLADGRPFLAMKLIKGQTLDELLDSSARLNHLAIIEAVAQALGYAHAHDVIHRDVKPANVMVGSFGEVQVMDWGLAKVLTSTSRPSIATDPLATIAATLIQSTKDGSGYTEHGSILGTPSYMPPEQAGGETERIGPASDVFGLGALWCRLLTGEPPFAGKDAVSVRRDAMRGKTEDAFARLDACGAAPEVVALCKQCLAFEPGDRPANANEVARRVAQLRISTEERARQAEVARARTEVQAAEHAKRRRVLMGASCLVALALLGGLLASLWQMRRAIDAEEQARANAENAEARAEEARAERDAKAQALVSEQAARQRTFAALRSLTEDVVERKFAQGSVLAADDRAFLRGVIAQFDAFAANQGDDADSRAVRAEGRFRVGLMHYRLGEFKASEADYDDALNLLKQLATDYPDRSEFCQALAGCHNSRGNLRSAMGRPGEAEADLDVAVALFQQLADDFPDRPELRQKLAGSFNNRGNLRSAMGRLKEAEADLDAALGLLQQLAAEFPSRVEFRQELASSFNNRGGLRSNTEQMREAEADLDAAVALFQQLANDLPTRPEFRHNLATSHNNRGKLRSDTDRLQEAETDLDTAVELLKQLAAAFPLRPQYRKALAGSHNNRGSLYVDGGRLQEAEEEFEAALGLQKQLVMDYLTQPEFRRDLAGGLNNRGVLRTDTGRPREAEQDFAAALVIQRQLVAEFPSQPEYHNDLARTCLSLAILHQSGKAAAAKQVLLEGRPHHHAALKANPGNVTYRHFYHSHLRVLTEICAELLEMDDAVRTTEARRDVGWDPPEDAYDAATMLSHCISIVSNHDKLDDVQRKQAKLLYADAAMKTLTEAVSKGFKDHAKIKMDPIFEQLRAREDFQKLVAELAGKDN